MSFRSGETSINGNKFWQNPMASAAGNTESSIPQSPWTYQNNFFSAAKGASNFFQAAPEYPSEGIAVVPISCIDLVTGTRKKCEPETKSAKMRKSTSKVFDSKQTKKKPSTGNKLKGQVKFGANVEKKNLNTAHNAANFDISGVPPPFCSCTGAARRCYRCGTNGWQSSCCTTTISQYPLPMSPSKPGARIGGRKMTGGAYSKLLQRLAAEGHDLAFPVDLKNHWAKLGTNKFVTIK